jgi:DNA polymerase-1
MGMLDPFTGGVWLGDFEFHAPAGERPEPICLVAREFESGQTVRLWKDELRDQSTPPFPIGADALFVAYYASAELGSFLALDWPMPARVLDLCAEFKCLTSGLAVPCGRSLLGALAYHGIDGIDIAEKKEMRDLAIRGEPFTSEEQEALIDYCESDVVALARLLPAMLPKIDLPRALLRGRYMAAAARMEWAGVPIDTPMLERLRLHWPDLQQRLINTIDKEYGVFEGRTFKADRFANYLVRHKIPWPILDSGKLALDDDTFRSMAKAYPELSPLHELRHSLSELRLESLAVGSDGRNRCLLSAFGSKTGRNQPSNSKFIFGPSVWLRSLIKPQRGRALAYIDYCQQEFGIAAALSGDNAMMDAYMSGDPYLAFAKQANAVPIDATAESHPSKRELFKACVLAVQYGMGERSLAQRIGQPEMVARDLLRRHRETYPAYWRWSQAAVDRAMLHGCLYTVFGWEVHVGPEANPRSLANFPCQANGAEMLRLACCLATERGINICAPVHDAVLIEASIDDIDSAVSAMQLAMAEASDLVLSGFRLRTKLEAVVRYPDRYTDEKRGRKMWDIVAAALMDLEQLKPVPAWDR